MKKSRLGLLETNIASVLSYDEISKFSYEHLSKGSTIYASFLKIVVFISGSAKLCFFEDGEEFIIYHLKKDNITIVDESCVLEILEDSEVYTMDADGIDWLFENERFCKFYTETLTNITLIQRQIIRSILFESAKGRIANFLIELSNEQNLVQNGYHFIFLPFSVKVLSSFVGLKRQSASTAFNELIKDGVIKRISPHEFLIMDFEKLQSYTN
ncbi:MULTISPECIES: Crp/Fnr family transcriptional regulator [unclassified Campylobacter]|uniref:Crp/Fnr family transcriptional regulator n=1 Tax=unclassified Campylobacter TaxID=2593542 RepID=UPI003D32A587